MSNWKHTLEIKSIWNSDQSIDQKGKSIATKIRKMIPNSYLDWDSEDYNEDIETIIDNFENITGCDDMSPTEEFDETMEMLYDWGDQEVEPYNQWPRNKMCWIRTQ